MILQMMLQEKTRDALYALMQNANSSQAGVGKVSYSDVIDTLLDIVMHIEGLSEAEVLEAIVITAEKEDYISEPTVVFGSPSNVNYGRKCGCQVKFRHPTRTTREDTGYDVYNCRTHEAGPKLVAAVEAIDPSDNTVIDAAEPGEFVMVRRSIEVWKQVRAALEEAKP